MTLPSFTRRAFLVPVLFLATLVGFSQANEASAQSLEGTWEFTWFDASSGDQIGTATITVDKKAKSFKSSKVNEFGILETIGLKINPSKNTFEGFLLLQAGPLTAGFAGAGIADVDQGIIIGGGNAFNERVGRPPRFVAQGPPVMFIGIKQ
ncbi:MAG: hypothetical protein P8M80_03570 [Pirellulaceae bacterium]|nr:hypothetical protein [Pirellulaceae bacterium]